MEQTDTGKCHYHAVLVAGINNLIISYRAAWLCHIFYTAFMCSVNVISNGKKASEPKATSVRPSNHALFSSLVNTSGFSFKDLLPSSVSQNIHIIFTNV